MAVFDLSASPFHVLGVSPRFDAASISRAADEAISSGCVDAADARAAERTLLEPESRLIAELGWLPGAPPAGVAAVRVLLDDPDDHYDGGLLPALARANVWAHRGARDLAAGRGGTLRGLLEAHAEIDVADLERAINIDRRAAGFLVCTRRQIEDALAKIRDAHAETALAAIGDHSHPPEVLAAFVRAYLADGAISEQTLDFLVEKYVAWAEPRLARAEAAVREAVTAFDRTAGQSELDQVVAALEAWRTETEGRRLLLAANGAEEPRTAELCRHILAVATGLGDTRDALDKAFELCLALDAAFPDMASVKEAMMRHFGPIVAAARGYDAGEIVAPILTALEETKSDFDAAIAALGRSEFRRGAEGWAGRLYDAFADAAVRLAGTESAMMPWSMLIGLSDNVRAAEDGLAASRVILDGLERFTEAPIPAAAAADLARLRQELRFSDLMSEAAAAMKCGRTEEALRLIAQAEALAVSEEDRETLRIYRSGFETGGKSRLAKAFTYGLWGTVAFAIAGVVILRLTR